MKCDKCGKDLEKDAVFCPSCGNQIGAPKKGGNKVVIIVVGILLVLAIGCAVAVIGYNSFKSDNTSETEKEASSLDKKDKNKEKEPEKKEEKIPETLDVSGIKEVKAEDSKIERNTKFQYINAFYSKDSYHSTLYVLLKNNNTEVLDATVYLNFYKDGVRIKSEQDSISNLKPNIEFVSNINVREVEEYDSIDLSISTKKASSYYIDFPIKKEELKLEKIDGVSSSTISASYTNKFNKKVTIYGGCKYYKNGQLVFASKTIAMNDKDNIEKLSFYDVSLPKGTEYDKYEVFIFSSYYEDTNY